MEDERRGHRRKIEEDRKEDRERRVSRGGATAAKEACRRQGLQLAPSACLLALARVSAETRCGHAHPAVLRTCHQIQKVPGRGECHALDPPTLLWGPQAVNNHVAFVSVLYLLQCSRLDVAAVLAPTPSVRPTPQRSQHTKDPHCKSHRPSWITDDSRSQGHDTL